MRKLIHKVLQTMLMVMNKVAYIIRPIRSRFFLAVNLLRREVRQLDIHKPVHAIAIGLLLAGIVVPVTDYLVTNQRYRLDQHQVGVMARLSPALSDKLTYDDATKDYFFNRDGQVVAKDALNATVGAGGKKGQSAYSAKIPVKAGAGIRVNDAANGVAVTMTPQFGTLDGRIEKGRVVYPLKDNPGLLALTPKANGLKEDILLDHATVDRLQFEYQLDIPETLVARLLPDGGVGFYSGDPALFGNINYGSDADRSSVELARKNAEKNYLMFEIPAPVVKQADGQNHGVKARFELHGKILVVIAGGLSKASYPLSIDPTFVITSASDFNLGGAEDNIDFSVAGQIGRALITGGTVGTWTATSSLPTITDYNFGLTAYNNNLYLVGGGNGASTFAYYVPINANGTLGTWTATTSFNIGRTGAGVVGFNGYVYLMGGENANGNSQFSSVEYSKVQTDGSLGTWTTLTATPMTAARGYPASTVYKGVIYVSGGQAVKSNASLSNTVEYAKIKADGTLGSWVTTTAFTTARDHHGMSAYNGFLYLAGGFSGTAALGDVQVAPINIDGTLGAWVSSANSMTAIRRSLAVVAERGYLYAYGGCSSGFSCTGLLATAEYAPIYADGTVGPWTSMNSFTTARAGLGGASYNGVLYLVGGCTAESGGSGNCSTSLADSQYAVINTPGNVTAPLASTSVGTARGGNAVTAYNGYIYSAGGCTGATCSTSQSTTVESAVINDDGTLGTWTITGMTALPAARYGGSLAAFNGKLYFCGGDAGGTLKNDCLSSSLSSTAGTNGAWTTETNTFDTNGRKLLSLGVWNNFLYVIGGTDNTTWYNTVRYSPIGSTGSLGTFSATTSSFTTGRAAHGSAIYNGNLYITGGEDSTSTKLTSVQRATIDSTGNITTGFTADTALPAARSYHSVVAHNSVLYVIGGMTSTTATNAILWASMTGLTGAISTWNTSAETLVTSRQNFGAVAYKGYLYAVGGCTSGQACTAYTATSDKMRAINGGVGQTSAYTTPTAFTTARADPQYAVLNGFLYIIGGCTAYTAGACSTWTTSVQSAQINPGGGLGVWTANTALGTGRSYGGAVVYNGFIYLIGGSVSGTPEDTTVLIATANNSGTLAWATNNAANNLPSTKGRYGFGAAVSGGFIYVAGGFNGANKNEVYYSKVTSTGDLVDPNSCGAGTAWCTTTAFTTARRDLSLVAYNSVLYVVGGYDGTNALSDTQYAVIGANGTIGSWNYTTRSDRGARSRQVVAGNGYMYFLGDETTNTDVMYTAINYNNTLGNLYKTVAMPAVHTNGGAVFYNGFIYAFAGCTAFTSGNCTAVSAAVHSTGEHALARVAHYSKLFDTQIDTAPSQFQQNGMLASGGSVIIASIQTASTSDPVLGVAQIINPALPGVNSLIQALNSSGTNVGVAFSYYVFLTLDDSGSGTFPDASSNITDFTIFYHANPGRRLRHGASFTNTGCNPTPTNGCILDTAP